MQNMLEDRGAKAPVWFRYEDQEWKEGEFDRFPVGW